MNKTNMQHAINIMKRAEANKRRLDMIAWQQTTQLPVKKEKHICNTPCCFAGFIAISPEFQAAGGDVGESGQPLFKGEDENEAIATWLNITDCHAEALCYMGDFEMAYDDLMNDEVQFSHVIHALEYLLEHGVLPYEL